MKPLLFVFLLTSNFSFAQETEEDVWDTYMAQYDSTVGSTLLNMSLKKRAPIADYPFVLVTGVTYSDYDQAGFPTQEEFPRLHAISDSVAEVINRITRGTLAGTFTHQCERLDYYYVRDTAKLRNALEDLYKRLFAKYKFYINIKEDKNWQYYLEFLYPNEATRNYMADQKVVMNLVEAGDKLEKPRLVEHWIYFNNAKDRDKFIEFVKSENFKVQTKSKNKESKAFPAHISRVDKVDLSSIYEITEHLRKTAKQFNGEYDGWETVVVRD